AVDVPANTILVLDLDGGLASQYGYPPVLNLYDVDGITWLAGNFDLHVEFTVHVAGRYFVATGGRGEVTYAYSLSFGSMPAPPPPEVLPGDPTTVYAGGFSGASRSRAGGRAGEP